MRVQIDLRNDLTRKQRDVLSDKSAHIVLKGAAGTGKTYLAIARSLQRLSAGKVERIVIIRSPVSVRSIGFLPGDAEEKLDVYAQPYRHLFSQLSPKTNLTTLVSKKVVEFLPTSFLRGVTLDNAAIILDEYQNLSGQEITTVCTRVGDGSELLLSGDTDQTDLKGHEATEHIETLNILTRMSSVSTYEFGVEDIVRSGFVKQFYETKAAGPFRDCNSYSDNQFLSAFMSKR